MRKVPDWHVLAVDSATEVAVRALLVVRVHWGPPCSDDLLKYSEVTGALVAGRAVT